MTLKGLKVMIVIHDKEEACRCIDNLTIDDLYELVRDCNTKIAEKKIERNKKCREDTTKANAGISSEYASTSKN